jgi:hypothetical protein
MQELEPTLKVAGIAFTVGDQLRPQLEVLGRRVWMLPLVRSSIVDLSKAFARRLFHEAMYAVEGVEVEMRCGSVHVILTEL